MWEILQIKVLPGLLPYNCNVYSKHTVKTIWYYVRALHHKKLRIWASTESFLKLPDFEWSEESFLGLSYRLHNNLHVQKLCHEVFSLDLIMAKQNPLISCFNFANKSEKVLFFSLRVVANENSLSANSVFTNICDHWWHYLSFSEKGTAQDHTNRNNIALLNIISIEIICGNENDPSRTRTHDLLLCTIISIDFPNPASPQVYFLQIYPVMGLRWSPWCEKVVALRQQVQCSVKEPG